MTILKSIPVNSGDCFYLEANNDKNSKVSALVDGGAYKGHVYGWLERS